jgi:nucleoside-diphosphate-sugar epimerase
MQTILGSGGAIGTILARELTTFTEKIRLVSRHPEKINPGDELYSADLTDSTSTLKAVEGSEVVYLVAGLPYDIKVWQEQWPRVMDNTIEACRKHGSKLVFFDNVYMYDPVSLAQMTEGAPIRPVSKKGAVRKQIAEKLLNTAQAGDIQAMIARSADFYGPGIGQTSVLNEAVIKPLAAGKTANWMGNMKYRHSFTYTPDAAKATALLGNTPSAYGEVWHLPTFGEPPTGREWVDMIARLLQVKPNARNTPRFVLQLMGLFSPIMKELAEMNYQYEQDYIFNSDKFESRFDLKPTPYSEGIYNTLKNDYPEHLS